MCMHDNNSDGIAYESRRTDRTSANYDPISKQYENRIRGDY